MGSRAVANSCDSRPMEASGEWRLPLPVPAGSARISPSALVYIVAAIGMTWELGNWLIGESYSLLAQAEAFAGPLCHHVSARAWSLFGEPFPVCARCSGIWFGWISSAPGLLFFLRAKPSERSRRNARRLISTLFFLCCLLALAEAVRLISMPNAARTALGFPIGLATGLALLSFNGSPASKIGGIDD